MFSNQGLSGSLGFLSGFRGLGADGIDLFARFLDESCAGDEIGVRRLAADIPITLGDTEPLTTSEFVERLSGGTWDKLIRSGRAVAARIERGDRHSVVIGDLGTDRAAISRLRVFGDIR
jgi:hypothetical protein